MNCKACHSKDVRSVYRQPALPFIQSRHYKSRAEALKVPCFEVDLLLCETCGLVFNGLFNENVSRYDADYNNNQACSSVFQRHFLDVIDLLEKRGFASRKVVEIGCGKGDFLRLLRQRGFQVTGFDPAFEGQDAGVVKDFFSAKYAQECGADLVVLRHTLEHIENPFEFLKKIAGFEQNNGFVYIEVPSFEWIVEYKAFWDIFPEHCNYFTRHFWGSIFSEYEHGLMFQGQYQYVLAQWKHLKSSPQVGRGVDSLDLSGFAAYLQWYRQFVRTLQKSLVWGAGAKGMTFVNLMDPSAEFIAAVVDINTTKQGKYVGRTGHPIIASGEIDRYGARDIILMNGNYEQEIRGLLKDKDLNCHVLGVSLELP